MMVYTFFMGTGLLAVFHCENWCNILFTNKLNENLNHLHFIKKKTSIAVNVLHFCPLFCKEYEYNCS
jgi:hypothetical protein